MDPSPIRGSPSHPLPSNHDSSNNSDHNQHRVRFAEGEPQASYQIRQPTARRERPSRTAPSAAQPALYWDEREFDRESDANLAGYTFYREGTPTPPEYESSEKRLGDGAGGGLAAPVAESSTAAGGTVASDRGFNLGHPDQGEAGNWSLADSNEVSPVTRRRLLWAIIAIGLLILIGIAVGVGVGLGVSKGEGPAAESVQGTSRSVKPHASRFSFGNV